MKIAKLYIDGTIGSDDIVNLIGGSNFSLSQLNRFIDGLDSDVTDLHVYINSGGGEINEGFAIYDKLSTVNYNVTTIGEGMVGSIATVIFMAGKNRKMYANSKFFIHNPIWVPYAPIPLEADELARLSEDLRQEETRILDFYSSKIGGNRDLLMDLMKRETSMSAEKAKELGFIDEIIAENIASKQYKLVAFTSKQLKNDTKMDKKVESWFSKMNKMLNRITKKQFMDLDLQVINENGNQVSVYVESEDSDYNGKPVLMTDSEGNEIQANGKYVTADGKFEIVCENGNVVSYEEKKTVEEVIETTEPAITELMANIKDLEEQNASLVKEKEEIAAQFEAMKAENTKFLNSFNDMRNEIETFKKTIIGASAEFKQPEQAFEKEESKVSNSNSFGSHMKQNLKK